LSGTESKGSRGRLRTSGPSPLFLFFPAADQILRTARVLAPKLPIRGAQALGLVNA